VTSPSEVDTSEAVPGALPEAGPVASPAFGGFYSEPRLVAPDQLQVNSSGSEFLHVAVIIQVLVGKDLKLFFRDNAHRLFSTILRHVLCRVQIFIAFFDC